MKDLPKTWVLTGKQFKNFRPKKIKNPVLARRTKQKKHKTPVAKMNMETVSRKKQTEAKLKKAVRFKLLEFCKTRTRKSIPDLFNFLVASAGLTWSLTPAGLRRAGANSKPNHYKNELPSENMGFSGKVLKILEQKLSNIPVLAWRTKQRNHKTPKAKTEPEPCSKEEINSSKIEKKHSDSNCWNFARLKLRRQVLTCSTFM